mmetsp:Transcript_58061/g.127323  ORF Transcript_58061/g.127323 Transcript_58061/m.127323 type:complete len:207 (-) Transcript_58061:1260-1880(-)
MKLGLDRDRFLNWDGLQQAVQGSGELGGRPSRSRRGCCHRRQTAAQAVLLCMALLLVPGHLLREPWLLSRCPRETKGSAQFVGFEGQAGHGGSRPMGSSDQGLLSQDHIHQTAEDQEAPGHRKHSSDGSHQLPRVDLELLWKCLRLLRSLLQFAGSPVTQHVLICTTTSLLDLADEVHLSWLELRGRGHEVQHMVEGGRNLVEACW